MNRSSLGLLLAMMGAARAAVHESMVPTAPATKLRRAAPDAPHVVVFAVKQPNIAYLEAQLLEMSDPDHAHYGRHFTRQYVNELTANPRGRAAVLDHLGTVPGVTLLPDLGGGAYVTAHAAVSVWEGVLATEFHVYHHQHVLRDIATELVRCESYSLPSALHDHVAFVMNTVQFPLATGTGSVRPTRQAFVNPLAASAVTADATSGGPLRPAAANCLANNTMSPCRLTQVYGVAGRGNALSTVGVFESLNQSFSPSDLAAFQAAFGLPNQKVATVVGGAVHGRGDAYCKSPAGVNACMESMLDLEYIMGVAPLSPATYWYSWNTTQDIFLDWILAVTSAPTVPLVLSLSYGGPEANVAPSQLQLFAAEAVKLGAQGTTLVVASGAVSVTRNHTMPTAPPTGSRSVGSAYDRTVTAGLV
jgi:tripeptidyl-peptidase-1